MFETAELGSSIDKETFEAAVPPLRVDLINAQYDLQSAKFTVIILVAGDDRIAANEIVDLLNEWMDARFIDTRVFMLRTSEEHDHPRFWRYWRNMPAHGRTGLFLGAWALNTIAERLRGKISKSMYEQRLTHERYFEQSLSDNGALILKFWMHLPKKDMKKRLKKLSGKDEDTWLYTEADQVIYENYDKFMSLAGNYIRETDSARARWHVIESTDKRYRNLTVARTILEALQGRLGATENETPAPDAVPEQSVVADILASVDLAATIEHDDYKKRLRELQHRLARYILEARELGVSSVLVFEGWDAAGKGGVIRRLTKAMPARDYRIKPIMAPTDEELAHPYLWRFWRHVPADGQMVIFDRSWYGRVLVERVEGFAQPDEWRRAYAEINDFEEQLVDHNTPVFKFWLHIDPEEQLRRFQAREKTLYKKYKITDEDYRNRDKWDAYTVAVNEMVARTSTEYAPWRLIPANDKRCARIRVLEHVCDGMKKALRRQRKSD